MQEQDKEAQSRERIRILCSKRESAAALAISVRTLEALIKGKQIKSVRVGKRRLIPCVELERFARKDHETRLAEEANHA